MGNDGHILEYTVTRISYPFQDAQEMSCEQSACQPSRQKLLTVPQALQ